MGDGGLATRSRPLGGPSTLVRRSPVAWFRRKQKSRSSWWKLQPRDLVFGPALPGQVARDVRPHPPHGGAACAYTCSRRLGCESRSANGRPGSSTRQPLWPKYNLAQKYRVEEWGIYDYEDRNGFLRFAVNLVHRNSKPLITFTAKGLAWNFLWEKVNEFHLCPKLSGLQTAKGPCYAFQSGTCKGGCEGKETFKRYNKRAQQAVDSFHQEGETVAIIGKGRSSDEKSLVLVEKGNFLGFGFFDRNESVTDFETAKNFITAGKENRVVQSLLNTLLQNPRDNELVYFE